MAQWVPKTAWKVSNLNKRYGPGYITSGFSSENTLGYTHMVHDSHKLREKLSSRKGIFVIDVRDPGERKLNPVPRSVALHHHDLLSGASCPILPQQKSAAELFVLASNESRGLNSAAALRRWGYDSVVQVDYNTLVEAGYVSRCDYATAGTKDSAEQAVSGED